MMPDNRLERVRQFVDEIIPTQSEAEQRRCGYVHLYGVSETCTLLAIKRGLDPELCAAMGMLHDIWSYGSDFSVEAGPDPEHGRLGIPKARHILKKSGFSSEEIEVICTAISHHSDKINIHNEFDELLKDADVLQHYLYNPASKPTEHWQSNSRLINIIKELGLK